MESRCRSWYTFTAGNLSAIDSAYAINKEGTDNSEAGILTVFDFGIPTGATIGGIQVAGQGRSSPCSSVNFTVDLSFDNGGSWSNSKTATFNTTETTATLPPTGGATDLWGHTPWTADESDQRQLPGSHLQELRERDARPADQPHPGQSHVPGPPDADHLGLYAREVGHIHRQRGQPKTSVRSGSSLTW